MTSPGRKSQIVAVALAATILLVGLVVLSMGRTQPETPSSESAEVESAPSEPAPSRGYVDGDRPGDATVSVVGSGLEANEPLVVCMKLYGRDGGCAVRTEHEWPAPAGSVLTVNAVGFTSATARVDAAHIEVVLQPGGSVIRGRVVDRLGGQISGATVTANDLPNRQLIHATAITDDAGEFAITVSGPRARLSASADGYAPAALTASAPSDRVLLSLWPGGSISGHLAPCPDDFEPSAWQVVADNGVRGLSSVSASLNEGCKFEVSPLAPGLWTLAASSAQGWGTGVEPYAVGVGELIDDARIELVPAGRVKVDVATSGLDCSNSEVRLTGAGVPSRFATLVDGSSGWLSVSIGDYLVSAQCDGQRTSRPVPLVVGEDTESVVEVEFPPAGRVTGRLKDRDGHPMAGIAVSLTGGGAVGPPMTRTDENGEFEFGPTPFGTWRLDAYDATLGGQNIAKLDAANPTLHLEAVVATGPLRGRLLDGDGRPVVDAVVRVKFAGPDGAASASVTVRPNTSGEFAFDALEPGEYEVEAIMGDEVITSRQVTHGSGRDIVLEVDLPRRESIVGYVMSADGGSSVDTVVAVYQGDDTGHLPGRPSHSTTTDATGAFELDSLSAGSWKIVAVSKSGRTTDERSVAAPGEIELRFDPSATVEVSAAPEASERRGAVTYSIRDRDDRVLASWVAPSGRASIFEDVPLDATSICAESGAHAGCVAFQPSANVRSVVKVPLRAPRTLTGVIFSGGVPAADVDISAGSRVAFSKPDGTFELIAPATTKSLLVGLGSRARVKPKRLELGTVDGLGTIELETQPSNDG